MSNTWSGTDRLSAKYIEGLENRLGRMESLLKMSGLLTEEEAGRTDLGTLEKRLADKATSATARGESPNPSRSTASSNVNAPDSQQDTPNADTQSSPQDSPTSPGADPKDEKKRQEVENLSDMMCSLVTNNVGETRYIGWSCQMPVFGQEANVARLILGLLDLLQQRNRMGQSEDRRYLLPGNHTERCQ